MDNKKKIIRIGEPLDNNALEIEEINKIEPVNNITMEVEEEEDTVKPIIQVIGTLQEDKGEPIMIKHLVVKPAISRKKRCRKGSRRNKKTKRCRKGNHKGSRRHKSKVSLK